MTAATIISPPDSSIVSTKQRSLPIRQMRKELRPSPIEEVLLYSQIKHFSRCPLQWWLARRQAPAFVPVSLALGGGFQAALTALFRGRAAGEDVGIDTLVAAFERGVHQDATDKGLPVRFNTRIPDHDAMVDLTRRMLVAFLQYTPPGEIVAVGEAFSVRLADDLPPVRGRIDFMAVRPDADGECRLHLVHFKTASRKPGWDDLDVDPLLLYALAARDMKIVTATGLPVALDFVAVTRTKVPEIVTIPVAPTPKQTQRLVAKIRLCHAAMRAGHCYPAPGISCATCGYSSLCAYWPGLPAPVSLPLADSA